ncbi:MAG: hypothetical protein M3O70_08870 [Actinomycetota bacterium]|nr:hypothetical protein [Actinomycetota bacterium]
MKIRMKVEVTGTRNGQKWPPVGGVIDLPDDEAAEYCRQGYADPVAVKPEDRAEKRKAKK